MNGIKSEKGQALILLAFGIVALIGFTALAVDGGRVLSDRRQAQNAADTAVLAAALSKINGATQSVYYKAGSDRAEDNKYGNTKYPNTTVEVNDCGPLYGTSDQCALPTGSVHSEYIRVRIRSIVPMTFGRVLGRQSVTNVVEAIARVQGSTSSGGFFDGAGMVSVRQGPNNDCFHFNGGATLHMHNTGIKINCTGSEALIVEGGGDITIDKSIDVGGCAKYNGNATVNGTVQCNQTPQVINKNTFANIPTAEPTPPCPANNVSPNTATRHLPPGTYPGNVSISGAYTMESGIYCFQSGFNMNGGTSITAPNGSTVSIVLGGNTKIFGPATFDKVHIWNPSSQLQINGTVFANELRFYSTGDGDFDVQTGSVTSGNAYIYSAQGDITVESQSWVDLKAPASGTYAGLLFYMPWEDNFKPNGDPSEQFILNGGTNMKLTGTILAPSKFIQYNGGGDGEIHGQIIGYQFRVDGNHDLDIYYNASENYNPPSNPTIELTK